MIIYTKKEKPSTMLLRLLGLLSPTTVVTSAIRHIVTEEGLSRAFASVLKAFQSIRCARGSIKARPHALGTVPVVSLQVACPERNDMHSIAVEVRPVSYLPVPGRDLESRKCYLKNRKGLCIVTAEL